MLLLPEGQEVWVCCHLRRDSFRQQLYLGANVSQEGLTAPPSDQLDGLSWDSREKHCRCCSGPQQVRPNLRDRETESSLSVLQGGRS